ncbi:MAG: ABC transporter permease [Microcystaceae cyanobacterium]
MQWRKVTTFLSVYYAHMLTYRAEIFLWVLAGSLPIILMGVWVQAAQDGNFSLTSTEFARYFFCVFQVRQFTNIWVIWDFEKDVVEGRLSFKLLQPLDPAWHHIARHIAEKITRFPLAILLTLLFFSLYPQAFWIPNLTNILLGIIGIVIGFTLRFLIQYSFAMLCFWSERATAIQQFWFLFYLFLSGIVAPLDTFPPTIAKIILWTPFPYLVYIPASFWMGLPVNLVQFFGVSLFWCVLFLLLNRWLWRKGLQQYSGMGA